MSNSTVSTMSRKRKAKPAPKSTKVPSDGRAEIRRAYDAAVKQLADAEKKLDKEGTLLTVPIFDRAGKKKLGTKQVRHPAFVIANAARRDVIRLAKLLGLGQPKEEPEKPGNARNQKHELEALYARCWELLAQQGDLLTERDARYRAIRAEMPPGPPWPDIPDDPEWRKRWERTENEYAELEAQIAAHKGLSNSDHHNFV